LDCRQQHAQKATDDRTTIHSSSVPLFNSPGPARFVPRVRVASSATLTWVKPVSRSARQPADTLPPAPAVSTELRRKPGTSTLAPCAWNPPHARFWRVGD